MILQKTIKDSIEFEGIGLHNGIKVNLCLKPAEVNSGIKYKRTDVDSSKNIIEASYKNVSSPILWVARFSSGQKLFVFPMTKSCSYFD